MDAVKTYAKFRQSIKELEQNKIERERVAEALRESQALYEKAHIGYQSLDENGNLIEVNPAWLHILGYSREEVIGKSFSEFIHPEQKEQFNQNFHRFKAVSEILGNEFEMVKKDGSFILVSFTGKTGKDRHGNFQQTHCIFHDITERMRSEEALRRSEMKYRLLAENATDVICVMDLERFVFNYISPSGEFISGYTHEELMSMKVYDFLTPDSVDLMTKVLAREIERDKHGTAKPKKLGLEVLRKDGLTVWVEASVRFLRDENNKTTGVLCVARDISERKKMADALRDREQKYKALFENSLDCIFLHDFEGNLIDINSAALDLLGYNREEVPTLSLLKLTDKEGLKKMAEDLKVILQKGSLIKPSEYRVKKKDGNFIYMEAKSALVYIDGQPFGIMGTARDITARKRAEEELKESEIKHKTLVNNIPGMIYRAYPDWSAEVISGCDKISGYTTAELNSKDKNWLSIVHPDDLERVSNEGSVLSTRQKEVTQAYRIKAKNGDIRWVEDRKASLFSEEGKFLWIDGVVFDITDRIKAEEEGSFQNERKHRIQADFGTD